MNKEDIVNKAIEALDEVLGSWVHGGDADCIIAEFEELLTKSIEQEYER